MSELLRRVQELTTHREEEWRIDILNHDDRLVGRLDGVEGGSFEYSIFNTIRTGGTLEYVGPELDWTQVRLQPWYTMRTAHGELSWPAGVFLPAAPVMTHRLSHVSHSVELYDKMLVLDQDHVDGTYTVDAGASVVGAVEDVIASAGESYVLLQPGTDTLSNAMVWEAGTSKLKIVNELLSAANYFSIWVDGYGAYRSEKYTSPGDRSVDWDFDSEATAPIHLDEMTHDMDTFSVPNRVVLIGRSDGEEVAPTASAENVDDGPFSWEARGERWITHTEEGVEASSPQVLQELAERRLSERAQANSTFELQHAPLPLELNGAVHLRHGTRDAFTVVQKYTWGMELGALMQTTTREVARR